MKPADQDSRSATSEEHPPHIAAHVSKHGVSPVWQMLLIIVILVIGVATGAAILGTKPAAPAAAEQGHGEHGHEGEKDEHGHGDKDAHGAEGRVEMSAAQLKNADLKVEEAGAHTIRTTLALYGKVAANDEAMAHVSPRFPGIVKSVRKRLGDPVNKGEVLAVVESNDSLRSYEVKSEIAGTITAKDLTLGELVNDQKTIFTITDLSSVYVDLNVYREDFRQLKVGQKVLLNAAEPGAEANADEPFHIESTIHYLSPFGAENTQSMLARAVVANPNGELRPGLFVNALAVTGEGEAPIVIKAEAIQIMDQKPVVFVQKGDSFEARQVKIGQRDPRWVEIISGVLPGDKYAAGNSFILKAEIGKEGAAHEH